ncbi:MAG: RNA polymerase sigma factor [Planctomycetota bacterium JB042]
MSPSESPPPRRPPGARASATTQWLVRRSRDGDPAALEQLLDRAAPRIRSRVRRRLGRDLRAHVESGDVAQEVLFDAARAARRLPHRGAGAFWRWLSVVIETRIRIVARRVRRKPLVPDGPRPSPDLYVDESQLAESADDAPDGAILRELDRLSDDHRHVLRLRHVHGLSFPEIARRMRRSENAVWMLHKRAQTELAARMLAAREE